MDSIKASFYFSDKKEESLFQFMKQKVEVAAASDGVQVTIVVKTIDELSKGNNQKDCLIVPFCTKNLDSFVGLKKAWEYRKKVDHKTPFLFVIYTKLSLPDFLNPQTIEAPSIKDLLGNPTFGDVNKAVLMAETFIDTDNSELNNFVLLPLTEDFFQDFVRKLKWIEKYNNDEVRKIRERFYHTFVDYYDYNVGNSRKKIKDLTIEDLGKLNDYPKFTSEIAKIKEGASPQLLEDVLELADYIHCLLNGLPIPKKKGTHNTPLELFRAPVPFPLQELVDARDEISKELKKAGMDKKIKLLLIDNRYDNKFIKNDTNDTPKAESLCDLLFPKDNDFCLGDFFEIHMLGTVYKKKNGTPKFYQNDNELSNYSDFNFEEKYEIFKFKKFKNKQPLEKSENEYHKAFIDKQNKSAIKNYADLVYHKIKDAHFVLLDFFLDDDDTYMAFDFIRDIADIKRREGNVSTTWYFTTSAVYDSVVKYSQSGLLAEYYESAVVSAGDDPTNEKRQIIFLYKLLTFINARIKSFSRYKDLIFERMLSERRDDKERPECCVKVKKNGSGEKREDPACQGECGKDKCLEEMQTAIKRYLTEYDNIYSLFYDEKDEYKAIVELLDDTITKFLLLPEADWQIIQHQIDYINAKLREAEGKRQFSCSYINKEIKQRSEIY